MARFPLPHSYIGIQPARAGQPLDYEAHAAGIHHIALWAKRRREIDKFYRQFLLKEGVIVTDAPAEYPIYAPGYYAVFFLDPTDIRWELAHTPFIPMPWAIIKTLNMAAKLRQQHPEWRHHPAREMMRKLPRRHELT